MEHGYDQHGNHSFKDDVAEPVTGSQLLRDLYETNGDGDEFGSAMIWLFATHELLYHLSAEEIPSSWLITHPVSHYYGYEFRTHVREQSGDNGSGEADTMAEILPLYDSGEVTDDDLITFGNGLNDDINYMIETGKDY
jgi:hypothetical protein